MPVSHLKLNEQHITELSSFFDLLAKFDFEDAKKQQVVSEEIETGSSLAEGEPLPESCETNILGDPSFKGREVQR